MEGIDPLGGFGCGLQDQVDDLRVVVVDYWKPLGPFTLPLDLDPRIGVVLATGQIEVRAHHDMIARSKSCVCED